MAVSAERRIKLNTAQEAAVASGLFLQGKRGEIIVSRLSEAPAGLQSGETAFERDSLGGVRRVLTQSEGSWQEVYFFGPIKNRDRELIARFFGLNPDSQSRAVTDHVGTMSFQRKYLIITNQKGGVSS